MRVVAGTLGGRRLRAPPGTGTRPTSDRVREAVFSMLGADVVGARVLDLFAGSGALGIEALSRGAASVVFVERERRALGVLRENLRALEVTAEVRPGDALRALGEAARAGEAYDLVLLDPPYRHAPVLGAQIGQGLEGLLAPGATVVAEMDHRTPLELDLPLRTERRYGDTTIRLHHT